ncbi:MAG: hypothetical protein KC589_08035, partial [Nanoarchaeota archaeon]|nr:hypothetical protein [Nanoarchaeota archaeon]
KIIRSSTIDNSEDFIGRLENKDILIYEDIQGSQIYVKYNGKEFYIRPKSVKNDNLNLIDLTVQKFYNQAFKYFHSLPEYITNLINKNWWFVFEYMPDNQPSNIEYSRKPKNSLILTCILKGSKHVYNYDEIKEYSKLFDVDTLPVLFKGKLSDKQLEIINLFLNTSEKDLKFIFGETNFAKFFYNILNPVKNGSFLMDDEFNNNMEKMIIRINGNDEYSFELLNPLHKRLSLKNNTEYVDIYSIILVNFLEFCQIENMDNYKLLKLTKSELYLELICKLFNKYMDNVSKDIVEWNFHIPEFFKENKFKINTDLLDNSKTIDYIKSNPKIEYVFKVILGSFYKKRKKPIGIFTEKTMELFNDFVEKISDKLDDILNINREFRLKKSDVMNFNDFFNLDFNVDNDGKLYPDVYGEFGDEESGGSKKKKGKKIDIPIDIGKKKPV